jgi:hypothetical protein
VLSCLLSNVETTIYFFIENKGGNEVGKVGKEGTSKCIHLRSMEQMRGFLVAEKASSYLPYSMAIKLLVFIFSQIGLLSILF